MKVFTSSYISLLNALDSTRAWAHLVELVVNANTTAYFTSHPETLTHNGVVYMPIPMAIGEIDVSGDAQLPSLAIDVSNFQGMAYRFAKDNDLSLNNVTIRLVNPTLTASGDSDSVTMQILGSVFSNETARFMLGFNFNYDALGPRRTWNRVEFPTIPYNVRQFAIF